MMNSPVIFLVFLIATVSANNPGYYFGGVYEGKLWLSLAALSVDDVIYCNEFAKMSNIYSEERH